MSHTAVVLVLLIDSVFLFRQQKWLEKETSRCSLKKEKKLKLGD